MAIPGLRLQRAQVVMEKPDDLYQHFFDKLSGQEESEEAFFTLLPQATAGTQDVLSGQAVAENQRAAVKSLLLKVPGPPPDLHEEWQLAADSLDTSDPVLGACNPTVPQQAAEQVDEHGVMVVPLGQEHSSCILDVAAELHVQVDNLMSGHGAIGMTAADATVSPVTAAYLPTAVQLAAVQPDPAKHSSRHNSSPVAGCSHSSDEGHFTVEQPCHDAKFVYDRNMAQLPPTAMFLPHSCEPCSEPTPALQDISQQGMDANTTSAPPTLQGGNIADEQCEQDTSCGEDDQDQVQAFSLDPSFDYDNVKLTVRDFPAATHRLT